jgi:hypothetical protein
VREGAYVLRGSLKAPDAEKVIMSTVIVRRYSVGPEGGARFSIRQREDGSFQVYRDNPYEGTGQTYQSGDEPISGIFADVDSAEAELFRHPTFQMLNSKEF